jgi:transcriptional regulator with XRE-family HTH domain
MAIQKPIPAVLAGVLAAARQRAAHTRQQLGDKPDPTGLLTAQELADAAPFYLVLRDYVRQLKEAREASGLTLADVSTRSGLPVESLALLESGGLTNPTWKTLGAYAAALGLRPRLTAGTTNGTGEKPTEFGERFSPEDTHSRTVGTTIWDLESLERLRIPDYIYREPTQGGFGFPQFRVFEVLAYPTDTEIIVIDDLRALIYAKATSSYADVICVQDVDGGKHKVATFAFRAFPDLCDTPLTELRALEIVRKMVDRFGVLMHIGHQEGKFFLKTQFEKPSIVIPGRDEKAVIHFDMPASRTAIMGATLKVDGDKIKVALAFGLEPIAYQTWLESH